MPNNLNGTINLLELFNEIESSWNRKRGLTIAFLIELLLVFLVIPINSLVSSCIILLIIWIGTYLIWLISSKRLFLRDGNWAIFWALLIVSVPVLFYYIIYPKLIEGSKFDLTQIRLWGTAALFFIGCILFLLIKIVFKTGNKILIVLAFDNDNLQLENNIKKIINIAIQNIEEEYDNIRFVIPPFGFKKNAKACEKYLQRPLTQADSLIYSQVIDGEDPNQFYFTKFTSRINPKRFNKTYHENSTLQQVVNVQAECKQWNFANAANDDCSRKLVISSNLEDMLRMYLGCVYLMKFQYERALPLITSTLDRERKNRGAAFTLAANLLSFTYLTIARIYEVENYNYDEAFRKISECLHELPISSENPGFNEALARLWFYKGDLKKSEYFTKKIKDVRGYQWGYELNMGFYALFDGKVSKFVSCYKRLMKYTPQSNDEVEFAINFLDHQREETSDSKYSILLSTAISFLYLYSKPAKAKRLISKVDFCQFPEEQYKILNNFKSMILSTEKRLLN